MFTDALSLLASIKSLGYFAIFLLFLVEGPIFNFVAGFAASLGFLNIYIIIILAVLGNFIGDIIFFVIGKFGHEAFAKKYFKKALNSSTLRKIKSGLKKNPGKVITIVKLTPPLPAPGLILAGAIIPFRKFMLYSFLISFISASLVVLLGFYSGNAFNIMSSYFSYGVYLAGVLVALVIVLIWTIPKMISKRITLNNINKEK